MCFFGVGDYKSGICLLSWVGFVKTSHVVGGMTYRGSGIACRQWFILMYVKKSDGGRLNSFCRREKVLGCVPCTRSCKIPFWAQWVKDKSGDRW